MKKMLFVVILCLCYQAMFVVADTNVVGIIKINPTASVYYPTNAFCETVAGTNALNFNMDLFQVENGTTTNKVNKWTVTPMVSTNLLSGFKKLNSQSLFVWTNSFARVKAVSLLEYSKHQVIIFRAESIYPEFFIKFEIE